jgi:hypothetical protein
MNKSITLSKAEWDTIVEALHQAVENIPDFLEDDEDVQKEIKAYNKVQSKLIKLLDK